MSEKKGESKDDKGATKLTVGDVEITFAPAKKKEEPKPKKKSSCSSQSSGCLLLILFMIAACFIMLTLMNDNLGAETVDKSPNEGAVIGVQSAGGSTGCEPGIRSGEWVKVTHLPGARMRSSPGYRNKDDGIDTIGYVGYGSRLQVLSGPQIADGLCWWRVRDESCGNEGWVADHAQGGQRLLKP